MMRKSSVLVGTMLPRSQRTNRSQGGTGNRCHPKREEPLALLPLAVVRGGMGRSAAAGGQTGDNTRDVEVFLLAQDLLLDLWLGT